MFECSKLTVGWRRGAPQHNIAAFVLLLRCFARLVRVGSAENLRERGGVDGSRSQLFSQSVPLCRVRLTAVTAAEAAAATAATRRKHE